MSDDKFWHKVEWPPATEGNPAPETMTPQEHIEALARLVSSLIAKTAGLEAEIVKASDRLETAEGLLRVAVDGGMTDYTEVENEPICGFCGYTVEDCESGAGQEDSGSADKCTHEESEDAKESGGAPRGDTGEGEPK